MASWLPVRRARRHRQLRQHRPHAEVSCGAALPSFGFGVFDVSNLSLDATATILFVPSQAAPLSLEFHLGTPEKPFSCSVMALAGQGSFGLVVTPGGLVVDASIAFGAAVEFDVAVARGGVSLTAGIHLHTVPNQEPDVGGFVHLSGGVEVLGLVALNLDAMLSLDWKDGAFDGVATVTMSVDVAFFHKDVSFQIEKTFAGGTSGTRSLALPMPPQLPGGRAERRRCVFPRHTRSPRPSPVLAYTAAWDAFCEGIAA